MTDLKTDLILAYTVSPCASDSGQLVPLIDLTEATTGRPLRDVLTDSGYPSGEELAACAARGVIIYSPWQENSFTSKKKAAKGAPPILPKEQFRWDANHRQYVCPQGHRLSYAGKASKQKNNGESVPLEVYQADAADCGGCPLRAQCVQSKRGARSVRRRPHEEHVEALKERMKTPRAKASIDSAARPSSGRLRTRRSTAVYGYFRDGGSTVRQLRPAYRSWSTTCGRLTNFAPPVLRSSRMPRKRPLERRNLSRGGGFCWPAPENLTHLL